MISEIWSWMPIATATLFVYIDTEFYNSSSTLSKIGAILCVAWMFERKRKG